MIPNWGWRWYVFVASLPVLIPLALLRVTPESPRFYAVSGQFDLMRAVLNDGNKGIVDSYCALC